MWEQRWHNLGTFQLAINIKASTHTLSNCQSARRQMYCSPSMAWKNHDQKLVFNPDYTGTSQWQSHATFARQRATVWNVHWYQKVNTCTLCHKKSLLLFILPKYNNNQVFSFVSRCGHLWCRSRRFDCILLVFIRRWGRLVTCHLLSRMLCCDWLVFSSCDWCISIFAASVCCSLGGPLSYGSPLDCGHPCFRNFYSTIPVFMLLGWSLMWITSLTLRETNKNTWLLCTLCSHHDLKWFQASLIFLRHLQHLLSKNWYWRQPKLQLDVLLIGKSLIGCTIKHDNMITIGPENNLSVEGLHAKNPI